MRFAFLTGGLASTPHRISLYLAVRLLCKPNMVYTVPPNVGATLVVARVVVAR